MELGYHVTLVEDATAAFDQEGMHVAHKINGARFAHAILSTEELLAVLPCQLRLRRWVTSRRCRMSQYSVPESAESAPSVDRTPGIRRDLVYLAEWMCKFNVLVVPATAIGAG
jgi:hypothetical protein